MWQRHGIMAENRESGRDLRIVNENKESRKKQELLEGIKNCGRLICVPCSVITRPSQSTRPSFHRGHALVLHLHLHPCPCQLDYGKCVLTLAHSLLHPPLHVPQGHFHGLPLCCSVVTYHSFTPFTQDWSGFSGPAKFHF